MCGVVGLLTNEHLGFKLYSTLSKMQHRGQDCWGVTDGSETLKYPGLIKNNYNPDELAKVNAMSGLGHTRYLTQGTMSQTQTQPFTTNALSFVHNGNIINTGELKELLLENCVSVATDSDSELLFKVWVLFYENNRQFYSVSDSIYYSVRLIQKVCKGSFFVIALVDEYLVAFKDVHGIRPGVWYKNGEDIVIASENCGLCESPVDVGPGELLIATLNGVETFNPNYDIKPCIFEYIYLANPSSTLYGVGVYQFRVNLAAKLTSLIDFGDDIDYVTTIPDSSRIYALELAKRLKKEYKEVIIKNNYSVRTFILPENVRRANVNKKFFFIGSEIKGKKVLIVDDSIVRGTTSKHVIEKLKLYGAEKVYMVSCAPIVQNCNCYGVKIDSKKELLSHGRTVEDMKDHLKCDKLVFQTLNNVYSIVPFKTLEDSIFRP